MARVRPPFVVPAAAGVSICVVVQDIHLFSHQHDQVAVVFPHPGESVVEHTVAEPFHLRVDGGLVPAKHLLLEAFPVVGDRRQHLGRRAKDLEMLGVVVPPLVLRQPAVGVMLAPPGPDVIPAIPQRSKSEVGLC